MVLKDVHIGHSVVEGRIVIGVLVASLKNGIVSGVSVVPMKPEHQVNQVIRGKIRAGGAIGAVAGDALNSLITAHTTSNVNSRGDETANVWIGGLVGLASSTQVTGYATGSVTGKQKMTITISGSSYFTTFIGGLVGQLDGSLSQITGYATGNVTCQEDGSTNHGATNIGGLLGECSVGKVIGYATGNVMSEKGDRLFIGGVIGRFRDQKNASLYGYARGDVEREEQAVSPHLGRLVGLRDTSAVIAGYHSGKTGESEVLPVVINTTGVDGTAVTISATTTQQDFSEFTFGSATGEWTFTLGRWPAINLPPEVGGYYLPQNQPTSP